MFSFKGIVAVSPNEEKCYMAYPHASEKGNIAVYDLLGLQLLRIIEAHKTPLSKLSFDPDGNLLASSSIKVYIFNG
jgi:autophagy-related protein 18